MRIQPEPPEGAGFLKSAAAALERYRRAQDPGERELGDLETACRLFGQVVAGAAPGDPSLPAYRYNLALALQTRYDALVAAGDVTDLRAAADQLERAYREARPAGAGPGPYVAVTAYALGSVLRRTYAIDHDEASLARAVGLLGDALAADDQSMLAVADCLYEYGRGLLDAAAVEDDPALLDEAVRALGSLVTGVPSEAADFPQYLDAAGSARLSRYERSARPADLRIACKLADAAVACERERGEASSIALNNLAQALWTRSGATRDGLSDLERAIALEYEAIALVGGRPAAEARDQLAGFRSNLAAFLLDRIETTNDLRDLDTIVVLADQAVAATAVDMPRLASRAHQAAIAHRTRYLRHGGADDLATAIRLHESARAATSALHAERLAIVDSYGSTLRTRYEVSHEVTDLESAIRCYREAVEASGTSSPDRAQRLNNLGAALAELAAATSDDRAEEEAAAVLDEAVQLAAPSSITRTRALINRGNVAADRFTRTRDPSERETAVSAYQEVRSDLAALGHGTESLLQAALNAAELAEDAEDWVATEAWSETALDTVDDLLVLQRDRRDKESWLRIAQGAADRAAWAAIRRHDLPAAVTLLERGRAALLREALDQQSLDRTLLAERAGPVLLRRLADATALTGLADRRSPEVDTLRDLRDEIRRVPGFETFLLPESFADIVASAAEVPLVYLAPGERDGAALVVGHGTVEQAVLPAFRADAVRGRAEELFRVHAAYVASPPDRVARRAATRAWNDVLDETAAWLGRVLGEELAQLVGGGSVSVVAGGLSGVLPIHAAWWPDEGAPGGRRYLQDHVVIGYVPSAAAFASAAAVARAVQGTRLVTITDPAPSTLARLPNARAEVELAVRLADGGTVTRLHGAEATVERLTDALQRCQLLHAGCHGVADLVDPLRGGLVLGGDRVLTLEHMLRLRTEIRLAVLSACESGRPGTALPDEVVSLSSGLVQAGAAGVVSSAWAVPDAATLALMTQFYRLWQFGAGVSPVTALSRAQTWMRTTPNADKLGTWKKWTDDGELPESAFDALQDLYLMREPGDLDDSAMGAWAAFHYMGA